MAKSKQSSTSKKSPRSSKKANGAATRATKPASTNGTTDESIVTLDRRARGERRNRGDRRQHDVPVAVERRKLERRAKVNRRRQIDPTTCERDYTAEEIEFMNALDDYKRASGRMFPTCSEILEVFRKLGYERLPVVPAASVETQAPLPVDVSALAVEQGTAAPGQLAL